jgi:cysteine desulfurase
VAATIGARTREIIFTSGATEANNLALKGLADRVGVGHIITCKTEHKAVLDTCKTLEARGFRLSYLGVGRDGRIDLCELDEAIVEDTVLVSLMAANNEMGAVHPLAEIGALTRARGVLWHCDAAQAIGKIPLDVEALGIDLLSLSAHKFYGPKGVGALYVRSRSPRVRLTAQMEGGGQERGLRAGTLNVPGVVGMGEACQLCDREMEAEGQRLRHLRQRLLIALSGAADVELNGSAEERLPGNLSVRFRGVDIVELLARLHNVALSSGAACSSGAAEPSHVLAAMGLDAAEAQATLRFGLGRFTTEAEIDYVAGRVLEEIDRLRAFAPIVSGQPAVSAKVPIIT